MIHLKILKNKIEFEYWGLGGPHAKPQFYSYIFLIYYIKHIDYTTISSYNIIKIINKKEKGYYK
jgi:hypothetical protein